MRLNDEEGEMRRTLDALLMLPSIGGTGLFGIGDAVVVVVVVDGAGAIPGGYPISSAVEALDDEVLLCCELCDDEVFAESEEKPKPDVVDAVLYRALGNDASRFANKSS